jgi:hypothetical protein
VGLELRFQPENKVRFLSDKALLLCELMQLHNDFLYEQFHNKKYQILKDGVPSHVYCQLVPSHTRAPNCRLSQVVSLCDSQGAKYDWAVGWTAKEPVCLYQRSSISGSNHAQSGSERPTHFPVK